MTEGLYYADYLGLSTLLHAHQSVSESHDEALFITTHQVYELWFRQIIHEVDSIITVFSQARLPEKDLGVAVHRLTRVIEIQKILLAQIGVLETMTPLDFLDFRDKLTPASGFQSVQFKALEIKLGLRYQDRIIPFLDKNSSADEKRRFFIGRLSEDDQQILKKIEGEESLFVLVERWLERTPFCMFEGFDFWQSYAQQVEKMLENDKTKILTWTKGSEQSSQLNQLERTRESFNSLLDEEFHDRLVKDNRRRLSRRALMATVFINLYRDEPILHLPFKFLNLLIEMDENFTKWRYIHALMAHRMLGMKIGTGGSSGHDYLKASTDSSRVFTDLFNVTTFLLPRSMMPVLPQSVRQHLGFSHEVKGV